MNRKNTLTVVLAASMMSLPLVFSAAATAEADQPTRAAVQPGDLKMAIGQITEVNQDGKTFALKSDTGSKEFKVNDKTTYTLDGKEVDREQALRNGLTARVSYDDQETAHEVAVITRKPQRGQQ